MVAGDQGEAARGRLVGHQPVLLQPSVEALKVRAGGVYVDGTFGRGGHSTEIVRRMGDGGGVLVVIDRDPEAVMAARQWQAQVADEVARKRAAREGVAREGAAEAVRIVVGHARFSELDSVLDAHGVGAIDGLLLDLGVSSPQLDDASRGFSFRADGPLDMRMDNSRGASARDWLLSADEQHIQEVLSRYGEERFAVPIATAIVARRRDAGDQAFRTTGELARLVADVVRRRQRRPEVGKDPATRTFQALRILVNQELEELADVLRRGVARLAPFGRLAVISFHSLEDRIVKEFIADQSGARADRDPITGAPVHRQPPTLRKVARVKPDALESRANPRARSAVLRVAERLAA